VDAQPGIPGYGFLLAFVSDYFLSHFSPLDNIYWLRNEFHLPSLTV